MRRVILAGVRINQASEKFESILEECVKLCQACHMEVAGTIVQSSRSMDAHTVFRSGKLDELENMVKELDADAVVFCHRISVSATSRIAKKCNCSVLDRTALILEIFSRRARSHQAKVQVELARLEYAMPRLVQSQDDEESHQRGGSFQNRGAGETRAASLKKRFQSRISDLKTELKRLQERQKQADMRRNKSELKKVALVGYTNAGKSSLMNVMVSRFGQADKLVEEKDMLFATLDTSIRSIRYDGRKFLLFDTVGFVSDLPHELVQSFQSTLSAAREADLLVEVIDLSDEFWENKVQITEDTLKLIHANHIPVLRVFNKIDCVTAEIAFDGCFISCRTQEGIDSFFEILIEQLYPSEIEMTCTIPYDRISYVFEQNFGVKITVISQDDIGFTIHLKGPEILVKALLNERIKKN